MICSIRTSAAICWCSLSRARAAPGSSARMQTRSGRVDVLMAVSLRRHHEMRATVLLERGLVVARVERKLLSIAHRLEPVGRDAERDQVGPCRHGPPIA